jgi:phosphate transport system protein
MDRRHTDKEYEGELDRLRELVLLMGARVEELIERSMRAFVERDVTLASTTIDIDRWVDKLEVQIDELCLQVLARRQPVASDLRFITTTLKLVTDLERIGDLGVNICERVIELGDELIQAKDGPILRIAEVANGMVHDALDSFVARDVKKAEEVVDRDRIVDAYYAQLFPELVPQMMANPNAVRQSMSILSMGKYIERIADHATNIAEMVIFLVRGEDIRHSGPSSHSAGLGNTGIGNA